MRFCEKCGTQIPEDTNVCPQCYPPVSNSINVTPNQQEAPKKKFNKMFIVIPLIIVVTVIATIAITSLGNADTTNADVSVTEEAIVDTSSETTCSQTESGNHDWEPPNCTEPARCFFCDEYKNNQLGNHDWLPANCTEPARCMYCYEYKDDKLGNHSWYVTDDGIQECEFCYMLYSDYSNN